MYSIQDANIKVYRNIRGVALSIQLKLYDFNKVILVNYWQDSVESIGK